MTDPCILERVAGQGRLIVDVIGGRTRPARLFQEGAAKIRLLRGTSDPTQAVLINTAGGLTSGDRLRWALRLQPASQLIATTPGCEKAYRAPDGPARLHTELRLAAGSRLDWLPQETILFDGASLQRDYRVDMATDATLLTAESVLLGRVAMGEHIRQGSLRDRWRIYRDDRLVHAEDLRLDGDLAQLAARPAVLNGAGAFTTLLLVSPRAETLLKPVRAALRGGGATAFDGKLVCRIVAPDGFALRQALRPVLTVLRDGQTVPRSWLC